MKKIFVIALALAIAILSPAFPGKAATTYAAEDNVLRIYSWEDYIYVDDDRDSPTYEKSLTDFFEDYYFEQTGKKIKVEYTTFGTNEIMYNNLLINPNHYDLLCPSDYMIQKLIAEDLVEPFDDIETDIPNFTEYGSPFLKDLFRKNGWTDYAVPYTWGTLGFIYNPEFVSDESVSTWECVTNFDYANKTTIKDSVRDTYFLGIALANIDDLRAKNEAFTSGAMSAADYSSYLSAVFNDTSDETIATVEGLLKQAKNNAFSLEVDSGKDDIVKGNVWINFAWSGDAVYALDEAEEDDDIELRFAVPKEGSNIWFDGWVMPKGANKELATEFLNFISAPENAILNMDYIGYTSSIAGEEVFDYVKETYLGNETDETDENARKLDLSYFFGTDFDATLYLTEVNRQLDTLYPSEDIINRCAIMQYFKDEENDKINAMWNRVRAGDIWLSVIVIVCVVAICGIAVAAVVIFNRGVYFKKVKKGYRLISTEPIK